MGALHVVAVISGVVYIILCFGCFLMITESMSGLGTGHFEHGVLPGQYWVPRAPIDTAEDVAKWDLLLGIFFIVLWLIHFVGGRVGADVWRGIASWGWIPSPILFVVAFLVWVKDVRH